MDSFAKEASSKDKLQEVYTIEARSDVNVVDEVKIFIPDCCREGWKSCPHVVKRFKPIRRNIGL